MKVEYRYFDIHAHVNINAFKADYKEVAERARAAGVAHVSVGTQLDTSRQAVAIAEEFPDGVYATVGLHPIHTSASYHDEKELGADLKGFTSRGEEFSPADYKELAISNKVVAIGECGLDYYRQSKDTREKQEAAFVAQIALANELNLPLMIHTRGQDGNESSAAATSSVYDDAYQLLKQYAKVPGNLHFYAGTYEQAKRFFDLGFSVSFTGVITFARNYDEVVQKSPLAMLHAETDCPYVAPVPYRGQRAEPIMVKEVYKKIAEIRGEDEELVRAQLFENALRLYAGLA